MHCSRRAIKKTVLATAVAVALGTAVIPGQASADILSFSMSGWVTVISPTGASALNNTDASGPPMYGFRTPINGTMQFDTDTNSGTMEMQDFSFFGGGKLATTNVTFQDIDGPGGASTLMLGNMGVDWNGSVGIPVSIVWDGEGLRDAIDQGLAVGNTIAGTGADFACDTNISCATPATEDFEFGFGFFGTYTLPIGAAPIASTSWNTTDIGIPVLGTNPSGTLPLTDDGIGGSPTPAGPFPGFNIIFDFNSFAVVSSPEPVRTVNIEIPGGDMQECATTSGNDFPLHAEIVIPGDDAVFSISWSLDGVPVASGEDTVVLVPLGSHFVRVDVTTVMGTSLTDTANVVVRDTTAPVIDVAFLDPKTGAEITSIGNKGKADISIEVSDACDASPNSSATAGLPVSDGDRIKTKGSKGSKGSKGGKGSNANANANAMLSIGGGADNVEVMVTADDASGNLSRKKATLLVTE